MTLPLLNHKRKPQSPFQSLVVHQLNFRSSSTRSRLHVIIMTLMMLSMMKNNVIRCTSRSTATTTTRIRQQTQMSYSAAAFVVTNQNHNKRFRKPLLLPSSCLKKHSCHFHKQNDATTSSNRRNMRLLSSSPSSSPSSSSSDTIIQQSQKTQPPQLSQKSSLNLLSSFYKSHSSYIHKKTTTSTSNSNSNAPILPLSTIQQYIGKNRQLKSSPFTWEELYHIMITVNDPSLLSRSIQVQSNYIHYRNQMKKEWIDFNDCIVYSKFGLNCFGDSSSCSTSSSASMDTIPKDDNNESSSETIFTKVKCPQSQKYKLSPSIQQQQQQKHQQKQDNSSTTSNTTIILSNLLPNDFPYYVESHIEHWCLWKLNDVITNHDIQAAIDQLKMYALLEKEEEVNVVDDDDDALVVNVNVDDDDVNCRQNGMSDDGGSGDGGSDRRRRLGEILDTIAWINPKHLQSIPDIDHAHIMCLREKLY